MRILWLHQPGSEDASQVGDKAAILSRLTSGLGFLNIPNGFCVTHEALSEVSAGSWDRAGAPSLPNALGEEVAAAYVQLGRMCGQSSLPVAVRPSGAAPDGRMRPTEGASRAFLGVAGSRAVADTVAASYVASRRRERDRALADLSTPIDAPSSRLAVLVQQMLMADACVIGSSRNLDSGDDSEMCIRANWGMGRSLLDPSFAADRYTIRKSDLRITSQQIADKERMMALLKTEVRTVLTQGDMRQEPAMDNLEVVAVARLIRDVEAHLGWAVEVECAIKDGRIHLLECRRAETPVEEAVAAEPALELEWQTPGDADRLWRRVRAGSSEPLRPLMQSYAPYFVRGWSQSGAIRSRIVGGRLYVTADDMLSLGIAPAEDRIGAGTLPGASSSSHPPENPQPAGQLAALRNSELALHLEETLLAQAARFAAQAQRTAEAGRSVERLVRWYAAQFPDRPASEPYTLLAGSGSGDALMAHRVWEMSRMLASPVAQGQRLRRGDLDTLPVEFRRAYEQFLAEYGSRFTAEPDPGSRTLAEAPSAVCHWIARYAEQDLPDPGEAVARAARLRDALAARIRDGLSDRAAFDEQLESAQAGYSTIANLGIGPNPESVVEIRRICADFERRMVRAGALESPTDLAYLTLSELSLWGLGLADPLGSRIAARKSEHGANKDRPTPETIGAAVPADVDLAHTDALFGPARSAASAPNEIRGVGSPAGVVRGTVRVVDSPGEETAKTLKHGDIVVCGETGPGCWVPLIGLAGALVTDSGGALCHAAMIAREFGVPAVVGTVVGTSRLRTGQTVDVDGDAGIVRISG